jgi:hypothetical protein
MIVHGFLIPPCSLVRKRKVARGISSISLEGDSYVEIFWEEVERAPTTIVGLGGEVVERYNTIEGSH